MTEKHQQKKNDKDSEERPFVLYLIIFGMVGLILTLTLFASHWDRSLFDRIKLKADHALGRNLIDTYPRCKADISSIVNALDSYKALYGDFPFISNITDDSFVSKTIISILRAQGSDDIIRRLNTNKIIFLQVSDTSLLNGSLVDPWGHAYHIAIIPATNNFIKVGKSIVSGRVAIWSNGPNGVNEYGQGDDVHNW